MLFYRKDVLEQAGIDEPPTTWGTCSRTAKARAAGIQPWAYGDRDGYTTSNMMTTDITSDLRAGRRADGPRRRHAVHRPEVPGCLKRSSTIKDHECIPADASTREQIDAANDLVTGKAAYMEGYPEFLPYFESLKDKIGVGPHPVLRHGPPVIEELVVQRRQLGHPARRPPTRAGLGVHQARVRCARQSGMITLLGSAAGEQAAAAASQGPARQDIAEQSQNYGMPVLDSVMPNAGRAGLVSRAPAGLRRQEHAPGRAGGRTAGPAEQQGP